MGALDGKVAIVTGAGQGLGRCHAIELASLGASVVVNDFSDKAADVVAEITAAGGKAAANRASVSDFTASADLVAQAVDTFGDLHIVVNNAGFTRDGMSWGMDEDQWQSVVDVHLKGHWCMSRHAGAYWRDRAKSGNEAPRRLINTTSEAGIYGNAGQSNYSPAKAGIVNLTFLMARELAKSGATANCIAPRARTAMTEHMPFIQRNVVGDDGFDKYDPSNVSKFVGWLASDHTSDISGQVFIVVGGEVHVMNAPSISASIDTGAPLSIEVLEAKRGELFANRSSEIHPF